MQGKIYRGQGVLIRLQTGLNISTSSFFRVMVIRPDRTTAVWNGTLNGTSEVRYQCSNTDLNQSGNWVLQAYVKLGTRDLYGEKVNLKVD
jgi:hypothetical protein